MKLYGLTKRLNLCSALCGVVCGIAVSSHHVYGSEEGGVLAYIEKRRRDFDGLVFEAFGIRDIVNGGSEEGGKLKITHLDGRVGCITPEIARYILCINGEGRRIKSNTNGTHHVVPRGKFHVKSTLQNERHGLNAPYEAAIFLWNALLAGEDERLRVIPSSGFMVCQDLARIVTPLHENIPIPPRGFMQISETVRGEPLHYFLRRAQADHGLLEKLDQTSFGMLVLIGLTTCPTDNKPDNFMVVEERVKGRKEESGEGVEERKIGEGEDEESFVRYRLWAIDNDEVLMPSIYMKDSEHGQHETQHRNILYFLSPLMDQRVDDRLAERMRRISPEKIMMQWLSLLQNYNQQIERLRGEDTLDEESMRENTMPIRLKVSMVQATYERLAYIVQRLKDNRSTTYRDLLFALDPALARFMRTFPVSEKDLDYMTLFENREDSKHISFYSCHDTIEERLDLHALHDSVRKSLLEEQRQPLYKSLRANEINRDAESSIEEQVQILFDLFLRRHQTHPLPIEDWLEIVNVLDKANSLPEMRSEYQGLWKALWSKRDRVNGSVLVLLEFLGYGLDDMARKARLIHETLDRRDYVQLTRLIGHEDFKEALNTPYQEMSNLTLLDKVMVLEVNEETLSLVITLVQNGAHAVSEETVSLWYNRLLSQPALLEQWQQNPAVRILEQRNPQAKWRMTFETLFPQHDPTQELTPDHFKFKSARYGKRVLIPSLAEQLFNKGETGRVITRPEYFIRRNEFGRRPVGIAALGRRSVHVKQYPELPAFEYAVGSLMRRMIGYGAPFVELVAINDVPYLISQTIEGENLEKSLVASAREDVEKSLNPVQLGLFILSQMVVNPEDGNPSNYIIENAEGATTVPAARLMGIDNDHAFAPYLAKEMLERGTRITVGPKSILYCFDHMEYPLLPAVRDTLLSLDMKKILGEWLAEMEGVHQAFTSPEMFNPVIFWKEIKVY